MPLVALWHCVTAAQSCRSPPAPMSCSPPLPPSPLHAAGQAVSPAQELGGAGLPPWSPLFPPPIGPAQPFWEKPGPAASQSPAGAVQARSRQSNMLSHVSPINWNELDGD